MILHAFGYVVDVLRTSNKRPNWKTLQLKSHPHVAVVIPVKHEPSHVLENTLTTIMGMDYKNKHVFLLDGSTDKKYISQNKNLAKLHGVEYFAPKTLHGAKAGIINEFLKTCDYPYLLVFDADYAPFPDFLERVVAVAEKGEKIAFVQTPQFYANIETSPIARGAAMQQSIFYESICEAKSTVNAMFCCGTNVLLRTCALKEIGGFDETSVTEDLASSLKMHMKGYDSIYFNHVRAFGMAPENLPAYFKQQHRWAAGTAGVFREMIKNLFRNPSALRPWQWWEYFLSTTYYFVGWAFFLLMLCPIMFLLFGVPSYFVHPSVYVTTFVPYYVMTLLTFYLTMRNRNYGFSEVYNGIILGSLNFPVLMVATAEGIFGKKMTFQKTPKGLNDKMTFISLWPWHLMIVFNLVAIFFGILNFRLNPYAMGINIFWCVYHIFLLSHIYHLNKVPDLTKNL